MDSILISIKKMLGIMEDYTHFDNDIIMHINTVLTILNQLGVGTQNSFIITDETATWNDFVPNITNLELIKTYIYLRVKLLFDPPISSTAIEAITSQYKELEWRILVIADPIKEESDV